MAERPFLLKRPKSQGFHETCETLVENRPSRYWYSNDDDYDEYDYDDDALVMMLVLERVSGGSFGCN